MHSINVELSAFETVTMKWSQHTEGIFWLTGFTYSNICSQEKWSHSADYYIFTQGFSHIQINELPLPTSDQSQDTDGCPDSRATEFTNEDKLFYREKAVKHIIQMAALF